MAGGWEAGGGVGVLACGLFSRIARWCLSKAEITTLESLKGFNNIYLVPLTLMRATGRAGCGGRGTRGAAALTGYDGASGLHLPWVQVRAGRGAWRLSWGARRLMLSRSHFPRPDILGARSQETRKLEGGVAGARGCADGWGAGSAWVRVHRRGVTSARAGQKGCVCDVGAVSVGDVLTVSVWHHCHVLVGCHRLGWCDITATSV